MDYTYNGIRRLDWGFDNPNMTAALIAMLAVAAFGVGLNWKKSFWIILPFTVSLMIGLIHTLSRGGLIALVVGFTALVVSIRPKLSRSKLITLVIVSMLLSGYTQHLGGTGRYIQGINGVEDRSISNRWLIYKSVPSMIVDAPQGWGRGNAPNAYHQWYQPEGRNESYINLVNSHFTWLVEWPWWARILYGTGWAMIFILLWPYTEGKASGIALAVWVTFFVAASFSSVAHRPWMWAFPTALLLIALIHRVTVRRSPTRMQIFLGCLGSVIAYAGIYFFALVFVAPIPVKHCYGVTRVGSFGADRTIAVYGTDNRILGERYGHRIRAYVRSHPGTNMTVFESSNKHSSQYDDIVLVGDSLGKFGNFPKCRVFLLNPSAPGDHFGLGESSSARIIWGSFNTSPAWYAWQTEIASNTRLKVTKLQGEGLYLESWLDEIN